MSKSKKTKAKLQTFFLSAVFVFIGGFCGAYGVIYLEKFIVNSSTSIGDLLFTLALFFVGLYIAVYVQIIIHEGGHLLFGLLTGYRYSSFRIGNLMWIKEDGKIHFKKFSLAGTGGQCLMTPPDMVNGKVPFILYNMGGPLMNFISGILFLGLFFILKDVHYLSLILLILAIIGLGFALVNSIPMSSLTNDGSNTLAAKKSDTALYSLWLQLKINEQLAKGIRLKDMPKEWFTLPAKEDMDNAMTATTAVFHCNWLIDKHEFEQAQTLMEELLNEENGIAELHRRLLVNDCIYCELISENRSWKIEEWFDKPQKKFMKSMKTFISIIRTEYAYALLAKNDMDNANTIKERFEKQARSYPYASDIESEQELLTIAKDTYNKEKTVANTFVL